MQAAVLENGHFVVRTVDDPTPGPGDLVLSVTGCGLCGSDVKARHAMADGTVMGHEMCGEVVAVGADAAERWTVGSHAAVLPVFSCGTCRWCATGRVAHCEQAALMGLGGAAGGFAEYVRVSAAHAFELPVDVAPRDGVLVEPFAVGLHAATAGRVGPGDRVLVIGGGSVGLTATAWSRALGAAMVTVSEPVAARREAAVVDFGASVAIDPTTEEPGGPYDVVIECVGAPGLLDLCGTVAEHHGRVVVAGVNPDPDPIQQLTFLLKELTVTFASYYTPAEFRTVIDAFADGRIDPSALRPREVALDELDGAFDAMVAGVGDAKVVVDPHR